ncbi:MAG: TolC family protein [Candidatus Omnitrophica bacterium]|nr:TolC family protein [Candidatus Omnitrophota bacterium]
MENIFKRNILKIISLVFLGTIGFGSCLYAEIIEIRQVSLSLEDAISLAFKNNKDILIQENEIKAAKARILGARGEFLPKVNINGGYTHRDSVMNLGAAQASNSDKDPGVFVGYEDEKRVGVSVEQALFKGGKNIANLKQANLRLKVQKENLRLRKLAVEFETQRLYYGILLAYETERIAQELLDQAQAHYEIVKKKFEQGAVSKFDLLQSKVQVSKVVPQLVRAQNAKELIIEEFKKLIGIDRKEIVLFQDKLTYSAIDIDEAKFLQLAYERRPDVIIKALEIKIGQQGILAAKASGRPGVNAGFNYDYKSDDAEALFNSRHNNWNIGISISIPVFDGFSAKAKVDEAKAKYAQAELSKQDAAETVSLEVSQGVLNLIQAQAIIESQQDSVEAAKEAVKIAEVRYENGGGTNIDVLDTQISLSQIEENLSQGIYEYLMGHAYLNKTMGVNLFEEETK